MKSLYSSLSSLYADYQLHNRFNKNASGDKIL